MVKRYAEGCVQDAHCRKGGRFAAKKKRKGLEILTEGGTVKRNKRVKKLKEKKGFPARRMEYEEAKGRNVKHLSGGWKSLSPGEFEPSLLEYTGELIGTGGKQMKSKGQRAMVMDQRSRA